MKLLSIVIPTRNREFYCISAIRQILAYDRDDFELCVCDNSDSDEIEDYLKSRNDARVVYRHIKPQINSAINMDNAMRMASGEYICMIGDDDAILPSIFEVAEWAKKQRYDIITPKFVYTYLWPKSQDYPSSIDVPSSNNSSYTIKDSQKQLHVFLKRGLDSYYEVLPRIYHGLVNKEILDDVLAKTGHIIGGLSPDIYMSITTACLTKKFVVIERPFTIAGACPISWGVKAKDKKISLELSENPQFYLRGPYIWDERVPKITTGETIWAETAIKAFEEIGYSHYIDEMNQGALFGNTLFNKWKLGAKRIINSFLETKLVASKFSVLFDFILYSIKRLVKGVYKRLLNKFSHSNVTTVQGVNNMDEAIRIIEECESKQQCQ